MAVVNTEGYEDMRSGDGVWNWEGPFPFGWVDASEPGSFIDAARVVRGGGSTNAFMNQQLYDRIPKDLVDVFRTTSCGTGVPVPLQLELRVSPHSLCDTGNKNYHMGPIARRRDFLK